MSEGFLSRWSRLKKTGDGPVQKKEEGGGGASPEALHSLGQGAASLPDSLATQAPGKLMPWAGINPAYRRRPDGALGEDALASAEEANSPAVGSSALSTNAPETPTLPDIQSLNMASDYTPFMQANVSAASRNAALKKLFTDPSFNVMDGLDTYVADYSQPDPIPAEMLKDLLKAKALNLFEDVEQGEGEDVSLKDQAEGMIEHPFDETQVAEPEDGSRGISQPVQAVAVPGPRVALPPDVKNEKQIGEKGR
jgi:Protein of unknown function (DUF3306)